MRPVSPLLHSFVEGIHYHDHEGEVPERLERILPGGRIHLMVNLDEDEFRTYHGPDCATVRRTSGAILGGPNSQASVIDTREQRCLLSVNFKLGGARRFFKMPLHETHNQLVNLYQLWGRDGAVLREQLLEAGTPQAMFQVMESALLAHLVHPEAPDPAVRWAAAAFEYGRPVSKTASELGFLPKTFLRRFRADTGLSPKRFARVRRLQRLLGSVGDPSVADWCALAAQFGYTDQAHLIHDFRDLTGLTPGAYQPRSAHEQNHVPVSAG
ncbi:MAG TPA: helix-turn-helix domain-containing protein [Bryobacteraceae bacterium]|nr:helix-turn-helix domain-containing protein [Bryobacteraceae bacterium]